MDNSAQREDWEAKKSELKDVLPEGWYESNFGIAIVRTEDNGAQRVRLRLQFPFHYTQGRGPKFVQRLLLECCDFICKMADTSVISTNLGIDERLWEAVSEWIQGRYFHGTARKYKGDTEHFEIEGTIGPNETFTYPPMDDYLMEGTIQEVHNKIYRSYVPKVETGQQALEDPEVCYPCKCEECGFRASSRVFLEQSYGDDADVVCPKCGSVHCDEVPEVKSWSNDDYGCFISEQVAEIREIVLETMHNYRPASVDAKYLQAGNDAKKLREDLIELAELVATHRKHALQVDVEQSCGRFVTRLWLTLLAMFWFATTSCLFVLQIFN